MKDRYVMIRFKLSHGMKILFVGINPHPGSYRRGVPFSNNKMFWYLLHDAGLLPETRQDLRDDKKLKEVYNNRFNRIYQLGLINLIDRPTKTVSELRRSESIHGRKRLFAAIRRYHPHIVCFVGKTPYQFFSELSQCTYGWQPKIASSKIYVMHAPHHGPAIIRIHELQELSAAA
jgi:double-stranded uracil-DNA glycosylase